MLSKTAAQQGSTKHPNATPVEAAAILLAPARRQEHLKNIKSLLHLPPKLYDALYYRVIERFAEFVQALPETQHGAFASPGGFLDHGLDRASRALTLCLSYFFPAEQSFHSINSEQALWIYAVFTAALLMDIGKIAVKYHITLCNKDSTTIKEWLPYSGSMVGQAKYYKFTYAKENPDHLRRLITGLLARQLLTEADETGDGTTTVGGFNWIASNPVVLEAWLNLLYGDTRNITSYLTVLPYADQLAIENNLAHEKATHIGKNALFGTSLFDTTHENHLTALAEGKDFLVWLRTNIENGKLSVNSKDSLIHRVEDGLLISTNELINRFITEQQHTQTGEQQNAQRPTTDPEAIKVQFTELAGIYNSPITQYGKDNSFLLNLSGSETLVKLMQWQMCHKPELLIKLGQVEKFPVNINIIKAQSQPAAAGPVHVPAEPQPQQQNNVQLQHR